MPTPQQNGDRVQLYDPLGPNQHNQHWQLVDIGGGWSRLVCREGGKVLDARKNEVHNNGCFIQLWDFLGAGQINQHWQLIDVGDGWSRIACKESGKVLDARKNEVHNNGCFIQLWDYLGTGQINQHWKLNDLGGGWFTIVNRESGGKVLDAEFVIEPPHPQGQQWCVAILSSVTGYPMAHQTITANSEADAYAIAAQVASQYQPAGLGGYTVRRGPC